MPRKTITIDRVERIRDMLRSGKKQSEIASAAGVCRATVSNIAKEIGLSRKYENHPTKIGRIKAKAIPDRCPKCGGCINTRTGYPIHVEWSCINCGLTSESERVYRAKA